MDGLPPLHALRAFEAAGRLLSIRKAAGELHVTPAAVSKQVRSLESHLGCALFKRSHQRIGFTTAGAKYHERISKGLEEIRRASRALQHHGQSSVLNIRSYTTFSMYWLIPRLSTFHAQHPEINIEITTSLKWIDFDREDVDAAIRLGDGKWPGLAAYRLISNVLAPACSPDLAARLRTPEDLQAMTLLHTVARPDDWKYWLDRYCADDIVPLGDRLYESSVLAYQAAVQGQGVVMAQLGLIQHDLTNGSLVLPFEQQLDRGEYTYYLVVPEDREIIPQLDMFLQWLLAQS